MALSVNIEKSLGNFSLKVAFEANEKTLALLGASGCGKSMTLKCIAGIEKPDKGQIILDGRVLFDSEKHINLSPQKRKIGYLFQQYALFPNMTVEQNIACGIYKHKDRAKIANLVSAMHLEGLEKKYPRQLSGGQQQRTALARILINEPDVLLLDEPFSALDAHLRVQMEQEVREVIKKFGKPVLLVSHDRDEVYRLSDRVAIMSNGHVEILEDKAYVFSNPGTVNGALLTGYSNISKASPVSEGTIFAEDWGVNLDIDGSSEGVKHVAVRTEGLVFGGEENLIPCNINEVVKNSFSSALNLSPRDGSEGTLFILHLDEVPEGFEEGSKVQLSIPKKEIKLLKD